MNTWLNAILNERIDEWMNEQMYNWNNERMENEKTTTKETTIHLMQYDTFFTIKLVLAPFIQHPSYQYKRRAKRSD